MVRLRFSIALQYQVAPPGGDFIFGIHAARTTRQRVVHESLRIDQPLAGQLQAAPFTGTRHLRLHAAPGKLSVQYAATVDIDHHQADPAGLGEVAVADLPGDVLPYLYPSRYCQSDRLLRFANREFGALAPGHGRVQAIRDWVVEHVAFRANTSDSNTSAIDTLVDKAGVCRDFAHLMIALCRALNMPARFATGIDYGADPALGPPDFHAYVEVYLAGRWYLFDASGVAIPMGFVRLATGRDAADTAFATIFGDVTGSAPVVQIQALPDAHGVLVVPRHVPYALSTDDAAAQP